VGRRFRDCSIHEHNSLVTAVKTDKEEKVKTGKIDGGKIEQSNGTNSSSHPSARLFGMG
jgi:uncharacterized protein (UPF0261 family)